MPTPAEIAAALVAREEMPPEKGDIGEQGLRGPQGDQGPEGPEGPQGPEGVQGPEGQQGIQGPKGDVGSRGPKGDKGDKGDPGRDGAPGASGRGYNVRGLASGMVIDNQGSQLNQGKVVGEIDFAGAGVSTAIVGGRAVVTIPGSPGGGGLTLTQSDTDPGAIGAGNLWLEALFGDGSFDDGYGRLWVRNSTDTGWNSAGPTTFSEADANTITSPQDNAELKLDDNGSSKLSDPTSLRLQASNKALFIAATGVHLGTDATGPALLTGSASPAAGGGVAAPISSIYIRTNGTLWQKTGAGNTAWTLAGGGASLSATLALGNDVFGQEIVGASAELDLFSSPPSLYGVDGGAGISGTDIYLRGGAGDAGAQLPGTIKAGGGTSIAPGRAEVYGGSAQDGATAGGSGYIAGGSNTTGGLPSQVEAQGAQAGGAGGNVISTAGTGDTGQAGGAAQLDAGPGDFGGQAASHVRAMGGGASTPGRIEVKTNDSTGVSGEALVSDAAGMVVFGGIYAIAAGVPSGAPDGSLPIAVDTASVGIYVWDGAAWVAASAASLALSDNTPLADSIGGDPGGGAAASRDDHIHPPQIAAAVADISPEVTPADAKINELLASLRTAGLLAA